MIFYLEDKKKWKQLMHFFKTCLQGSPNVVFLWNSAHGWLLMQNSEYLSNLDSDHLVLLAHFRLSYFSSFIASPQANPFCRNLDRATFSLDISRIYASLRSIRSTTKRVMFSISRNLSQASTMMDAYSDSGEANFLMKVFDEDGVLEIQRQVTLDLTLNQSIYFRQTGRLSEENEIFLELQQSYLRSVKEFRNCIVQMKFLNDHICVESVVGGQQDLVLQINRSVCKYYNYEKLMQNYENRNRLLVPPNFLIAQIYLANKLNQSVQMYIGDELMQGGRTMVYLVVAGESFQIISAFATVLDFDSPNAGADLIPFNVQQQKQQQQQQRKAQQKQQLQGHSPYSDNLLHTNGARHSLNTNEQMTGRSGFEASQSFVDHQKEQNNPPRSRQQAANPASGMNYKMQQQQPPVKKISMREGLEKNSSLIEIEAEMPPLNNIKQKPRLIPNSKMSNILKTQTSSMQSDKPQQSKYERTTTSDSKMMGQNKKDQANQDNKNDKRKSVLESGDEGEDSEILVDDGDDVAAAAAAAANDVHAQVVPSNTSSQVEEIDRQQSLIQASNNSSKRQMQLEKKVNQEYSFQVTEVPDRHAVVEIQDDDGLYQKSNKKRLSDEKRRESNNMRHSPSNQMSPLVSKLVSKHNGNHNNDSQKSVEKINNGRSAREAAASPTTPTNNSASPQYYPISQTTSKGQGPMEGSSNSYQQSTSFRSAGKKDFLGNPIIFREPQFEQKTIGANGAGGCESKLLRKNREHMELVQSEVAAASSNHGSVERRHNNNKNNNNNNNKSTYDPTIGITHSSKSNRVDAEIGFFKSPAPIKKQKVQEKQQQHHHQTQIQLEESNQMRLHSQGSSSVHSGYVGGKDSSNNRNGILMSASASVSASATSAVATGHSIPAGTTGEGFGGAAAAATNGQNSKRVSPRELLATDKSTRRGFFNVGLFPVLKQFETYFPDNKSVSQKSYDENPLMSNVNVGGGAAAAGNKSPDSFGGNSNAQHQLFRVKKEQKQASMHLKKGLMFESVDGVPGARLGGRSDPNFEEYERNQNYGKLDGEIPKQQQQILAGGNVQAMRYEALQGVVERKDMKRNNSFDNFLRQNRVKEEFTVFQLNHLAELDNNERKNQHQQKHISAPKG